MQLVSALSSSIALGLVAQLLAPAPAPEPEPAAEPAAEAKSADVALLPLRVEGTLPKHLRADMEAEVQQALERADQRVVPSEEVVARSSLAKRCEVPQCFQGIATELDSRFLVIAAIEVRGRDYGYTLTLIDGATGEPVADANGSCDICGHDEAREALANEVAALSRKLAAQATSLPTLVVVSSPAGAQVTFDGEILGVTPLEVQVDAGQHDIRVEKPGYIAARERVAFVDGVTESLNLELVPLPRIDDPTAKLMRSLGWASVGVSVAALITGGVLIGVDKKPVTSRCEGDDIDYLGNCRYRYATLEGGVAFVIVGVALAAGGATLLVLERKRQKRPLGERRARVRPSVGFGGLGLRF